MLGKSTYGFCIGLEETQPFSYWSVKFILLTLSIENLQFWKTWSFQKPWVFEKPRVLKNLEFSKHGVLKTLSFSIGQVETNPFSYWLRKMTFLFPIGWILTWSFPIRGVLKNLGFLRNIKFKKPSVFKNLEFSKTLSFQKT